MSLPSIAVNRVVKKKTPAAQVIAAEFIADVVSEQVRLVISVGEFGIRTARVCK